MEKYFISQDCDIIITCIANTQLTAKSSEWLRGQQTVPWGVRWSLFLIIPHYN